MLKNYLKLSVRTLRRHKSYTTINLVGLATGMACFMLIALYVQSESQYDRFHENADRIVRVTSHYSDAVETRSFARSNPAIGPALLRDFPEIEQTVRFQRYSAAFKYGDQLFNETDVMFAEASVFEVFSFPLVRGESSTALSTPDTAVLTEQAALRYFGTDDPIGKTIVMSDTLHFTVTGIAENVPAQSHINFDILLSFATYKRLQEQRGRDLDNLWTSGTFYTYALLNAPESFSNVESQLSSFVERHVGVQSGEGSVYSLGVQPLTDIHLESDLRQEMGPNGSRMNNIVFSAIAAFILLISCINFMNLATARSAKRAREVGVRKSLGAIRCQLVGQFLSESIVLSVSALVLAVGIMMVMLPFMNDLAGTTMSLSWSENWIYGPIALSLALLVGVISGSYPAFFLSAFLPARVLKGSLKSGKAGSATLLRKGLVVFQFTLSIAIIAGTIIAVRQVDYMQNQSLGFDQERVVVIPFSWDQLVQERYETLKQVLLEHPSVDQVTASGDVPGRMFTSMSFWIEGMPEEESGGTNALIVDPDFAETYGLEMVAGSDFSVDQTAGLGESFILNETAVAELGMTPEEVIGKRYRMNTQGPVIGVVKDFHFAGLQSELEPLVMTVWPSWFGYISVKITSPDLQGTMADVQRTWNSVISDRPFESFFLDDDFNRLYQSESRFSLLFKVFAALAILISCLGLFGLAVFTAEQRRKEIGVRKVMGASVSQIVLLLNRDMTLLVVLASVLATPIAAITMNRWMDSFAYQAGISWSVFLISGLGALVMMWITVAWQSVKAAHADPIKAIRYE